MSSSSLRLNDSRPATVPRRETLAARLARFLREVVEKGQTLRYLEDAGGF